MKKKHSVEKILVLVAAVLLVATFSFYVSADGATRHIEHSDCIAIRTEKDLLQMQPGSNYYLETDITVSETVTIDGEISLCLNGKILKNENTEAKGSIFRIGKESSLRIFDCSEKVRGYITESNGLWVLADSDDAEDCKELKGGAVIGGTGEKMEIEELKNSYFCGGFAYIDGGALFIHGGNIVGNCADYGGAVYVTNHGHLEVNGGTFIGNLANFRGGAIFVHSGNMILNDGSVEANKAKVNGGGINISSVGNFEMRGGSVTGNTAGACSGGIENFGMFDMYGGIVSANGAAEDAGGIYNGGAFTMHGGTVSENTAKYGGGVCNDGKMTLHSGNICANLATASGGAIYNADKLVINGGKISSNTAVTSGGGIENDGTCVMYGGTVGGAFAEDSNTAHLGGGVCVYKGSFTMYGGTIERNTAVDGGGVENEAVFVVQGGTVAYNFASTRGGGITNRGELRLLEGANIVSNASGAKGAEYKGGGIFWIAKEKTTLEVSGTVTVMGNTTNGESANLVICGKGTLSVSGISADTRIGLTLLNGNQKLSSGPVAYLADPDQNVAETLLSVFTSDHRNYGLQIKETELILFEKNFAFMIGACVVSAMLLVGTVAVFIFSARKKRDRR